jgi:protein-tyrosine-phosphatase
LPFGVDLRSHRSRVIDTPALLAADLVVGMEPWHGSVIGRRFPKLSKPCVLLSDFEEPETRRGGYLRYNVPDPYGRDMRSFEECFARIDSCLRGLRARLA